MLGLLSEESGLIRQARFFARTLRTVEEPYEKAEYVHLFYIPAEKRSRKAELEAMRAATRNLDEMIASWGATEEELMDHYKAIRRSAPKKRRDAKSEWPCQSRRCRALHLVRFGGGGSSLNRSLAAWNAKLS